MLLHYRCLISVFSVFCCHNNLIVDPCGIEPQSPPPFAGGVLSFKLKVNVKSPKGMLVGSMLANDYALNSQTPADRLLCILLSTLTTRCHSSCWTTSNIFDCMDFPALLPTPHCEKGIQSIFLAHIVFRGYGLILSSRRLLTMLLSCFLRSRQNHRASVPIF